MKRLISLFLLTGLLLSLCACQSRTVQGEDDSAEEAVQTEELLPASEEEDSSAQQEEETVLPQETDSTAIPQLSLSSWEEWVTEEQGERSYSLLRNSGVSLSATSSTCSRLQESVSQWSEAFQAEFLAQGAYYTLEGVPEDCLVDDPIYTRSYSIEVARVDALVLSLLVTTQVYGGGAATDYAYQAVCFSSVTGEQLSLGDILADEQGFYAAATDFILDYLEWNYSGELFSDYVETVEGLWQSQPVWYLDAVGLCLILNQGEVGPNAMGEVLIHLSYQDFGDYLLSDYALVGSSGVLKLPINQGVSLTLADGSTVICMIESIPDESDMEEVYVSLDYVNSAYLSYGYCGDAYFLSTAEGRSFLLVDLDYASDDYVCFLYELVNGELLLRSRLENANLYDACINTESLLLGYHLDVLGSYSTQMLYTLDDDGCLVQAQEVFQVLHNSDSWYLITVLQELSVTLEGEPATLSPGTQLRISGSDNNGTAYFVLEDSGESGSLLYTPGEGENAWQLYIDGISEYDCFDGLPYAG